MSDKPVLIVFAGPNGSGKSTLTQFCADRITDWPALYINADELQKQRGITNLAAAEAADRLRREALAQKRSFVTETVMSTDGKIQLMRQAKAAGYEVRLFFITTQSPEINKARVGQRVQAGGHAVPEDKIVSRYERAMRLLPQALQAADKGLVFDNSFEEPKLILEKDRERGIALYPQSAATPFGAWTPDKLEAIRQNVLAADRQFQAIEQAPAVSALPKAAPAKMLFNAYAKELLTRTGQGWSSSHNQEVARAMLKDGLPTQRVAAALRHSPDKAGDVFGMVKAVAREPALQSLRRQTGIEHRR